MRRIEAVEKDLKALAKTSASKDDLSRLRAEIKKIYDGLDVGMCRIISLHRPSLLKYTLQNSSILGRMYGVFVSPKTLSNEFMKIKMPL